MVILNFKEMYKKDEESFMFKAKYKLLVILFIALVFFNPVKTFAMFDDCDSSDDATQTKDQGKKPAPSPEKSADPAAEDPPPPPPEAMPAPSSAAPVDYNHQLEEMLGKTDPARIEVRVIQRLHAIDQSGVFSEKFKTALDICERLRNTPSEQILVNGNPLIGTPTDDNLTFQGLLAARFVIIPSLLLENLYTPEIQQLSLTLIRTLNDMQNEDPRYATFFTRVNQLFYHSRRLLATTICPQIIKTFGIPDAQDIRFQTVKQIIPEGERNAGGERNTQVCEFTSQGKSYACLLRKKTSGTHFGAFVDIGEVKRQVPDDIPILRKKTCKRFFLKAYHGYPALENKDSGDTKLDTEELRTSITSDPQAKAAEPLNLCEPFVYKLLERLDLGPKVYFMINPYISNGFYIVTEGLNNAENEFIELDEIADIELMLRDEGTHFKFTSDLTEVSLVVNALDLGDIKGDNLGYTGSIERDNFGQMQLIIIDFLTPLSKKLAEPLSEKLAEPPVPVVENLTDCVNAFLIGHVFVSDEGVKAYIPLLENVTGDLRAVNDLFSEMNVFKRQKKPSKTSTKRSFLDPKQKMKLRKDELEKILPVLDQDIDKKITQGRAAMSKFESRFSGQSFESVVQATEQEIIDLLCSSANFGDSSLAERPNFVALGLQEDSFRPQLREYCEFICQNFNELKGFLTERHEAWLANLHQQIDAALEEARRTMAPPAPPAPPE
jgi:hypothetical protein